VELVSGEGGLKVVHFQWFPNTCTDIRSVIETVEKFYGLIG